MTYNHKIIEPSEVADCVKPLRSVCLDVETSGFDWWGSGRMLGIGFGGFSNGSIQVYYCPFKNPSDRREALRNLMVKFSDPATPKIGANIKFDAHFIRRYIPMAPLHDIQVMARLVRTDFMDVSVDILIKREYKAQHEAYERLKVWCRKNKVKLRDSWAKIDPVVVGEKCCEDVYWTIRLAYKYMVMLKKDPKLLTLYTKIEMPLLEAVISMEEEGIRVDREYLKRIYRELGVKAEEHEQKLYDLAGKRFNPNSQPQLREVLIAAQVPAEKRRRKKGNERVETLSWDKRVLEKHESKIPLVGHLLAFRTASKLQTTYAKKMFLSSTKEGRLHTQIRQETARTGRLGSAEPNLMNLPREVDE